MKESIRDKLDQLVARLAEVDHQLADSASLDGQALARLGRERAEIEPVVSAFGHYRQAEADRAAAREMLSDPEMAELAREEIATADAQIEQEKRERRSKF